MDSEGNLMMIVGVSMLSKPVSVEGLRHALETRFLVYSRFRSRVVSDMSGAWWQEQEVDLDDHVIHTALPSNKNKASNKLGLASPGRQAVAGAAQSGQAAVANAPGRQLHGRGRQAAPGPDHPHPPLHRRRRGAGGRVHVDVRQVGGRERPCADRAWRRPPKKIPGNKSCCR
ncbi:hypothetical protein LP419_10220 [Massilia sp. H-1]|nr:hypothetical protein LP419_10220 [Massilia sp. H-1]